METIAKIYKIGHGPSSSHTMGPRKAASIFIEKYPNATRYRVTLYGSLAATGKGHLTDKVIIETIGEDKLELLWEPTIFLPFHPNGMKFEAFDSKGAELGLWITFSVGGGDIADEGSQKEAKKIYELNTMADILEWCQKNGRTFWEYVEICEGPEIWDYLKTVWEAMQNAIHRGLENEGVLPGIIKLPRKASSYLIKAKSSLGSLQSRSRVFAYALAVSEENAAGGVIVTAPTCGSCGVIPAVMYHMQERYGFSEIKILRALATAGIIGNLVKKNASISGAKVGCQGEVGAACAMASGAATQLFGGTPAQIEYAAEMGLEHHLGLTCDPVAGLVQIPCIERNAFAAARALDSSAFAAHSDGSHHISFDKVVKTMKQTGKDLPSLYKETSEGGLAFFTEGNYLNNYEL
ncbi:MAG: L-serine ammonia-lyase [Bacteroidales bacterium]|nr:L-serine ammonia-lyase [Bacteroidales bacterium]